MQHEGINASFTRLRSQIFRARRPVGIDCQTPRTRIAGINVDVDVENCSGSIN
jgi:hypothetical protein